MTAITFPSNPTVGQVFTTGNLSYIWNGTVWASNNIATVDASNVTGLDVALAEIVDAAPAALDTLNELAAALGDDANFAATVTSSLAGKAASVHTHAQSDVTGLATALASKVDTTSAQVLSGKTLASASLTGAVQEGTTVTATGFAGYTFDAATNAVVYSTGAATANGTVNIRANASTALNTFILTNEALTIVLAITNGATPYYPTAWQIDGVGVTPKWSGGTAPTGGNASAIDIYTMTIIKTGPAAYTVLGSQAKFA